MKNTITTTIITVAVTAAIEGIGRWLWSSSILGWIWSRIKEIGLTLIQPVGIPFALLAILVLMSGALVLWIVSEVKKESKKPSEFDYTKDSFDGLTWRWKYNGGGHIYDTWCFCPKCDTVLTYSEKEDYSVMKRYTHFSCDHCRGEVGKILGTRDSIVSRIERLIDRSVRSGDYRAVLERQKSQTSTT